MLGFEISTIGISKLYVVNLTPNSLLKYNNAVAGLELIKKAGAEVTSCGCIIELPELNGRQKLGEIPLFVLCEKEDTEGGLA
jgi:hypothetical protein